MGQKFAHADTNGSIIAFYDDAIHSAAQIDASAIKITDAQWQDMVANPGKWRVVNGAIKRASAPSKAKLSAIALRRQAQAELDVVTGSRGTIIRCVAAGVAIPAAWASYVKNLRAIVNGTDTSSTALPKRPRYPAGT